MLWERSAGAFFSARQLSHFTRQLARFTRSWSSGKMLAFQPKGFVFEPARGYALICLQVFRKQKVLTFFGTLRLFGFVRLFFGFVRLFFRNFLNVPKESSFHFFLIFCKRTNVKKSQRVPFFRIFGHYETFQNSIFFSKIF